MHWKCIVSAAAVGNARSPNRSVEAALTPRRGFSCQLGNGSSTPAANNGDTITDKGSRLSLGSLITARNLCIQDCRGLLASNSAASTQLFKIRLKQSIRYTAKAYIIQLKQMNRCSNPALLFFLQPGSAACPPYSLPLVFPSRLSLM